ncbi:MAG: flagellar biosynthesis protein FliQ [bacterium]|nr:flagellar biosynthesis protein FliQ [Bacillota bacterium]HHW54368.1 flagellar biosynthesis protein FliQ [Bacillota bacterium]
MNEQFVIALGQNALLTLIKVAGPMLASGLLVGIIVSLFQATTQIQEQTLTFIPKILAILAALVLWGPWMLTVLLQFAHELLVNIPYYIQ